MEAGGSGTERRFFLPRITRIFKDFTDGEELGVRKILKVADGIVEGWGWGLGFVKIRV